MIITGTLKINFESQNGSILKGSLMIFLRKFQIKRHLHLPSWFKPQNKLLKPNLRFSRGSTCFKTRHFRLYPSCCWWCCCCCSSSGPRRTTCPCTTHAPGFDIWCRCHVDKGFRFGRGLFYVIWRPSIRCNLCKRLHVHSWRPRFNFEALKHWLRLDLAPKLLGVVKGLLRHFFPQHTASKHGLFDNQPKLVEVSRRRRRVGCCLLVPLQVPSARASAAAMV